MVHDRVLGRIALPARAGVGILLGQILAGAKGLVAGAGDDGHEQGRLLVEPGEDRVGVPVGVVGDGVALVGAVDGDEENAGFGEGEIEVVAGGGHPLVQYSVYNSQGVLLCIVVVVVIVVA